MRSVHGWLDSTVALYWIKGRWSTKQFVVNRVSKIRDKHYMKWRHVGIDQNPADVGSRGCEADKLPELWLKGPEWLTDPEQWPVEIIAEPSKETETEAKLTKEVFATAVETKDELDEILERQFLEDSPSDSMDQKTCQQLQAEQISATRCSLDDS